MHRFVLCGVLVPAVRQWDGILGPAQRAGSLRVDPGAHAAFPGRPPRAGSTLCAVTSGVTAALTREGGRWSLDCFSACTRGPGAGPGKPAVSGRAPRRRWGETCRSRAGRASGGDVIVLASPRLHATRYSWHLVDSPWAKQGGSCWSSATELARGSARYPAYVPCAGLPCWPCVVPRLPMGTVFTTVRARPRGALRLCDTANESRPAGPRLIG